MLKIQVTDNYGFFDWHGLCKRPSDWLQSEGNVIGDGVYLLGLLKALFNLRFSGAFSNDRLFVFVAAIM
jgi:hypothetical protein